MAGVIFTGADPDEVLAGEADNDDLWALWLRAGVEQPGFVGHDPVDRAA
jgi:hypothetical protein